MKKIVTFVSACVLMLGTPSCSDWLEMPSSTKFDSTTIFTDISRAEMAVTACYTQSWMQELWYQSGAGNDIVYSSEGETNGKNQIGNFVFTSVNCPTSTYTGSYNCIERCNVCIRGLKGMSVSGADSKRRDMLLGEVLALRAHYFLNLIRYYGDVPYPTVPVDEMDTFASSRVSRDQIYDGCVKDLMEAVDLLPWYSEGLLITPERISKNAAYGLLARVALYAAGYSLRWDLSTVPYNPATLKMDRRDDAARVRELYQIADKACEAVINKGENSLVQASGVQSGFERLFRSYNEGGSGNYFSEESMFEAARFGTSTNDRIGYTNGIQIQDKCNPYGKSAPGQRILPTYYLSFDGGDTRRDVTVGTYSIDVNNNDLGIGYGDLFIGKWRATWKAGPRTETLKTDVNWPLLRYSDVLLMYAETQNWLNNGPTAAAKDAYEKVRLRAYKGDNSKIGTTPSSQDAFFEAVIQERAWELGGEGWRKTDLCRWDLLDKVVTKTKTDINKLANKQTPYDQAPRWRVYTPKKSTAWKDPLVALENQDFVTLTDAEKRAFESAGKTVINLFDNPGGGSRITGVEENKGVVPSWITSLHRGYQRCVCELYPLHPANIIDKNPGLAGQQHPAF